MSAIKFKTVIFFIYLILIIFFLREVSLSRGVIVGGDWGFPVTLFQMDRYLKSGFYTWTDRELFGTQQFFLNGLPFQILTGLVAKIGITGEIYIKPLLILAFVFPAFSMFLLCNFLGCSGKIAFFGGFLYITLPFFFNYAAMGWLFVLFSMGILPLAVIFFIKSVKEKKVSYSILTGILYFLALINSQSLVWYPLVFLCLAIFFIEDRKSLLFYTKSLSVVFLVFLGVNAYLWLPLLVGGESGIVSTKLGLSTASLGTWARLSYLNILRVWGSLFNYQYEVSYPKFLTPLSFFLPILSYFSLIFIRKKKILLSFAVLSFITAALFTLGPKVIVGLPFSDIFRDIARSLVLPSFSYAVMTTLFLDFLFKQKKKYLFLVGIGLIILLIINAYPFLTGELWGKQNQEYDTRLRTYQFPPGYLDLEKYLKDKKEDAKVLYLPVGGSVVLTDDKRFFGPYKEIRDIFASFSPKSGVWGISDRNLGSSEAILGLKIDTEVKRGEFNNLEKLLPIFGAKYVAVRNNALFGKKYGEEVSSLLKNQTKLILDKGWNKISLFENKNFLPHFYISQNIIYSNGSIEDLPEIVGLPDYQIRSGIYLGKINGLTDLKINELKRRVNEVVVVGNLENGLEKDYFERLENFKNGVLFPYVKHQPGSFGWKLARLKEKYEEWKVRKEPEKLIDKKLFFAGKRISEVEKFNNINELTNLILTNYKEKMEEAIEEVRRYRNLELKNFGDWEGQVIKLRAYLEKHREKINKLFINELTDSKLKAWEGVFEELESKIAELEPKPDFGKLVYQFEIPKKGDYEIFIKNINELTNYLLTDSGESTKSADEWVKTGERNFGEGKQELVLPFSGMSKNLVDKNLEIRNYSPNSMYQLSLDYQASESGKILVKENEDKEIAKEKIFPTEGKFKHLEMFFQSSAEATSAAILFSKTENNEEKKLNLNYKNLQVKQIYQPEVILKSIKNIDEINELTNYKKTPKITFVKVNPTKYRIKVEGAKNPYTLVFSESFHKGWKLYINELTDSRINELKNYGEIVASYFDGEIKEGTHRMTFLERATFETWGKKPIAEDRHYLVNGYANSWYITPDDAEGKENYELIVEFWPQRLFYIGLFISGATLAGCLSYLIYDKIKRIKN